MSSMNRDALLQVKRRELSANKYTSSSSYMLADNSGKP